MKKAPKQPKKQKVQKHECKEEEYKQAYLRALADYKNLEHRTNQERQRMFDSIKKRIVMDLLPVLDNLAQAEVFTTDPGLSMVSSSFHQALTNLGVSEVALEGMEFDPELAEAVEVVPGEKDNIVTNVSQKAYKLNGHVIRHGKVTVSKKQ